MCVCVWSSLLCFFLSVAVAQGKRVVDAGAKAVDFVSGMPTATSVTDAGEAERLGRLAFKSGGDEHGMLFGLT